MILAWGGKVCAEQIHQVGDDDDDAIREWGNHANRSFKMRIFEDRRNALSVEVKRASEACLSVASFCFRLGFAWCTRRQWSANYVYLRGHRSAVDRSVYHRDWRWTRSAFEDGFPIYDSQSLAHPSLRSSSGDVRRRDFQCWIHRHRFDVVLSFIVNQMEIPQRLFVLASNFM